MTTEPIACLDVYRRPDRNCFRFGKKGKKSQGARAGAYGGYSKMVTFSDFRICFTISYVCICMFALMLYVPVNSNSNGHIGTLPHFFAG